MWYHGDNNQKRKIGNRICLQKKARHLHYKTGHLMMQERYQDGEVYWRISYVYEMLETAK